MSFDLFSLSKKTAVVTGGSGLIGNAIVNAFVDAGARVINVDLKEHAEGRAQVFEKIDLSNDDLEARVRGLLEKHSASVWVNSAYPRTSDWGKKKLEGDAWRENIDLQLNSYCLISQEVAETWKKLKVQGSLVNLGSIYGVVANQPGLYDGTKIEAVGAYAAIKAGVINYSKFLAAFYGQYGIRVNALCPGGIEDSQDSKFVENYSSRVPLKRMGRPQEAAAAAVFLASDASSYITGSTLMVDGGWTAV